MHSWLQRPPCCASAACPLPHAGQVWGPRLSLLRASAAFDWQRPWHGATLLLPAARRARPMPQRSPSCSLPPFVTPLHCCCALPPCHCFPTDSTSRASAKGLQDMSIAHSRVPHGTAQLRTSLSSSLTGDNPSLHSSVGLERRFHTKALQYPFSPMRPLLARGL
mgnify:CR=1 FL=1